MKKEAAPEGAEKVNHDTTSKEEVANIVPFEDNPVNYDIPMLRSFIDTVFHKPVGEVFAQISKKAPGGFGGIAADVITDRLGKSQAPLKAYFSTSSFSLVDGEMRHTKLAFEAYHLLVLDDVGTKIPWASIPEALAWNYNIETSPGSHHLGYILAEPITDYAEAQGLIDLFVDAGLTDPGGAMPCKKVRLPCGVNGKKGAAHQFFNVHLVDEIDPTPWEIQDLLDAAGIDVVWEDYRKTCKDRNHRAKRIGGNAWNPDLYHVDPHTGIVDPLLEWLYEQGMVIQDSQEPFYDIICPFHDSHTDKDLDSSLAGYSPLGHGLYPHKRVFHCFHSHGKGHTASDYVERLVAMGAPEVPLEEFAPKAMMNYVFDSVGNRAYDISCDPIQPEKVEAVNMIHKEVWLPRNGKFARAQQLPLWIKQPSSLKVKGVVHDPSTRDRIVDRKGHRALNLYQYPDYAHAPIDMYHVEKFLDFVCYLMPDEEERAYFLDWLTCKVQDPSFRGAALLVISQTQGVGKNVLFDIITGLFGTHSGQEVDIEELTGGTFNEHMMKSFICVNELMAFDDYNQARRAYNKLKRHIDPAARELVVNVKMMHKVTVNCCTSFMLFSNHPDAIKLDKGDRRFYAIEGASEVRPPEFYADLVAWRRSGKGNQHLWNWFMQREVDVNEMMKPAPQSETKEVMEHEAADPLDHLVEQFVRTWPSDMVPFKALTTLAAQYIPEGIVPEVKRTREYLLKQKFNLHTHSLRKTQNQGRIKQVAHATRNVVLLRDDKAMAAERVYAAEAWERFTEGDQSFKQTLDQALKEIGVI